MSSDTGRAQAMVTEEILIAQVTERVLQSGASNGATPQIVEALATTAVQELWPSPVKAFILVLATREVQQALRQHAKA